MLIIGAKGFAKEILEILHQKGASEQLYFYDDVNKDIPDFLYGKFKILKNLEEAKAVFENGDRKFTIGIGNPLLRLKLYEKFKKIGEELVSTISDQSVIGSFDVEIDEGCNVLSGSQISNSVKIGKGCIIYYNSVITHDVEIGDFCEISPSVNILGRTKIGNFVQIGAGTIIFPDLIIGDHSIIAAGSVVRQNVAANTMVAGVPAIFKKTL